MFRYLIAAVLAVPAIAFAQTPGEAQRECVFKGSVFQQAASYRDAGMSPELALKSIRAAHFEGVDDRFMKRAINLVYFDPGFAYAGGVALQSQVMNLCMHPDSGFKPLE